MTEGKEYIEFVGTDKRYGTEFHSTHTVTAKDLEDAADIDLGKDVVTWRKGSNGRFLVPASELTPEAVEYLASDPMFRLVKV